MPPSFQRAGRVAGLLILLLLVVPAVIWAIYVSPTTVFVD